MKEKLNEALELLYEGLGEWAGVSEVYSPEGTQPFKAAAMIIDDLSTVFDNERENLRKELEGRLIDRSIKHSKAVGTTVPFEVGRRKHRGKEYKVLISVIPVINE